MTSEDYSVLLTPENDETPSLRTGFREPRRVRVEAITFLVAGLRDATGRGIHLRAAHPSPESRSKKKHSEAEGSAAVLPAELFIEAVDRGEAGRHLVARAFDGTTDDSTPRDGFRFDLGPQPELSQLNVTLRRRQVRLEALRWSSPEGAGANPGERVSYTVDGVFPLREDTSLLSGQRLLLKVNGSLDDGDETSGSGYSISGEVLHATVQREDGSTTEATLPKGPSKPLDKQPIPDLRDDDPENEATDESTEASQAA